MNRNEQLLAAKIRDFENQSVYDQIQELLTKAIAINYKARGIWNHPRTKTEIRKSREPSNIISELHTHTQEHNRLVVKFRIEDERSVAADKIISENKKMEEKLSTLQTLVGESIQFLMNHGEVINTDFTVENALEMAKSLRFNQLVEEREFANEPEYLKDECSECSEWYPTAHRCSCGNRRIYYGSDGNSFKDLYIFPVAN